MSSNLDRLPTSRPPQWRADVEEIVSAYYAGGERFALRVCRAICEARHMVLWMQLALREDVRRVVLAAEGAHK